MQEARIGSDMYANTAALPKYRACDQESTRDLHTQTHTHTTLAAVQTTQALLARLVQLAPDQLPDFVEVERESLTVSFLSYVSSQAKGGTGSMGLGVSSGNKAVGGSSSGSKSPEERRRLANLAARLMALKEEAGGRRHGIDG